jgi:hypothetical protein
VARSLAVPVAELDRLDGLLRQRQRESDDRNAAIYSAGGTGAASARRRTTSRCKA